MVPPQVDMHVRAGYNSPKTTDVLNLLRVSVVYMQKD